MGASLLLTEAEEDALRGTVLAQRGSQTAARGAQGPANPGCEEQETGLPPSCRSATVTSSNLGH